MKKRYLFLLLAVFAIQGMSSQEWERFSIEEPLFSGERDSLSARPGFHPVGSRFFDNVLTDLKEHPQNYLYVPVKEFTASSLSYAYEEGDFKPGAAPGSGHEIGLLTQGIARNEKGWVFFGDFGIKKIYLNDLKWNLSYQLPEDGLMEDPHYFGVARAAPWSNQEYQLDGGMLLPLLKDRLHLLVAADYRLTNNFRAELDPRPRINYNRLGFLGGLNYKLSPAHHLKLGASYSYAHIDNEFRFYNREQNKPVNYDRYVKWIAGLGYMLSPIENSTKRRYRSTGFSLGYSYRGEHWLVLSDLEYNQSRQRTFVSNGIKDEDDPRGYFSTYTPDRLQVNLSALYTGIEGRLWRIALEGESFAGENLLQSKGGKTYAAEKQQLGLGLSYLKQDAAGSTDFEVGWNAEYSRRSQKDALAATKMETSEFSTGVYAQKRWINAEGFGLAPFGGFGLVLPLQGNFYNGNASYFEQLDEQDFAGLTLRSFYQQVLLPDFELQQSKRFSAEIGANLSFDFQKKFQSLLRLQGGLQAPFGDLEYFSGKNPLRLHTLVSFTIIY